MTITLNGDSGITTPMYNGTVSANQVTPSVNMKNRIINGAMVIDQRNAGASVSTSSGSSVYTLDRWIAVYNPTSKFTIQQSSTAPVGFTYSDKGFKTDFQLSNITSEARDIKWANAVGGKKVMVVSNNNSGLQFLKLK